ncbi:MAG: LacI family DNA-binding transcriptional regulator [Lachnospiraceae bacterium]|nr:LacI family DNA-binding transcriptional regulator [Lachnospiraceae bacterium]
MADLTIKDIAKLCGVGTSTVSRAMNNDSGIRPETRERIMRVVKEFHYIPNNSARNLKMTESNTIGLIVKGINNRFFQSMYQQFEEELSQKGYDFILKEIGNDQDLVHMAEEISKEKRLKGLIFLGGMMSNPDTLLQRLSIPYVLCTVALNASTTNCASVSIDDEAESRRITAHLCEQGHRRIAVLAGRRQDSAVGMLRIRGYEAALRDYGIEPDPKLIAYTPEEVQDYTAAGGFAAMQQMLESGADFTAVFAISDLMAFGAYKAIFNAGKRIPEDYSVVGFDGIELTQYMHPSLTTLGQPTAELASTSIRELIKVIEGDTDFGKIVLEGTLLVRDSVRRLP